MPRHKVACDNANQTRLLSHPHRDFPIGTFVKACYKKVMSVDDPRTPCPPYGYSCFCDLPVERQIELVAEFHAYRIRPTRIAYRLGIDIALIESLLAGEFEASRFERLVKHYRTRRLRQRLGAADKRRGQAAYEQRQIALREFELNTGL